MQQGQDVFHIVERIGCENQVERLALCEPIQAVLDAVRVNLNVCQGMMTQIGLQGCSHPRGRLKSENLLAVPGKWDCEGAGSRADFQDTGMLIDQRKQVRQHLFNVVVMLHPGVVPFRHPVPDFLLVLHFFSPAGEHSFLPLFQRVHGSPVFRTGCGKDDLLQRLTNAKICNKGI